MFMKHYYCLYYFDWVLKEMALRGPLSAPIATVLTGVLQVMSFGGQITTALFWSRQKTGWRGRVEVLDRLLVTENLFNYYGNRLHITVHKKITVRARIETKCQFYYDCFKACVYVLRQSFIKIIVKLSETPKNKLKK